MLSPKRIVGVILVILFSKLMIMSLRYGEDYSHLEENDDLIKDDYGRTFKEQDSDFMSMTFAILSALAIAVVVIFLIR